MGVLGGFLGGSKNQKSGKCHELPRKSIKKIKKKKKPGGGGVEVLGGSRNQKSGKCHELPRKSTTNSKPGGGGGVGWEF